MLFTTLMKSNALYEFLFDALYEFSLNARNEFSSNLSIKHFLHIILLQTFATLFITNHHHHHRYPIQISSSQIPCRRPHLTQTDYISIVNLNTNCFVRPGSIEVSTNDDLKRDSYRFLLPSISIELNIHKKNIYTKTARNTRSLKQKEPKQKIIMMKAYKSTNPLNFFFLPLSFSLC